MSRNREEGFPLPQVVKIRAGSWVEISCVQQATPCPDSILQANQLVSACGLLLTAETHSTTQRPGEWHNSISSQEKSVDFGKDHYLPANALHWRKRYVQRFWLSVGRGRKLQNCHAGNLKCRCLFGCGNVPSLDGAYIFSPPSQLPLGAASLSTRQPTRQHAVAHADCM